MFAGSDSVAELNAYQPAFLASYPTTLAQLATEQAAGRLAIHPVALWSGGEYGPEASVLTSVVLLLLFAFLWKTPVRPQPNLLLDEPVEK